MSNVNSLPSERVAIVGNIDPDAYTAAAYSTDWIPLKNFGRYMAVVQAGDLGASATVDAKLTAAVNSSGGTPTDIPGATIVQLTQAGTDSNKQAIINLNTDTLAGTPLFTHFRLTMTVGTATSDAGAIVFGFDPGHEPASDNDATTVDSITSV